VRIARRQRWIVAPQQAVAIQRRLRANIVPRLPARLPKNPVVAGADISYDKRSDRLFAAVVLLQLPGLEPVEHATVTDRARFPYVPGLLSFREAPALLKAFRKLRRRPDVVMIDGHGLAHPRRFGIACHIGWLLGLPTIGCAKSILCGEHGALSQRRGASVPLVYNRGVVGCTLRTRAGVRPVYVSVGHRIDLRSAAGIVLRCAPRFRIPAPTREAHILVNKLRCS
jgi:deoxyribonuclease V